MLIFCCITHYNIDIHKHYWARITPMNVVSCPPDRGTMGKTPTKKHPTELLGRKPKAAIESKHENASKSADVSKPTESKASDTKSSGFTPAKTSKKQSRFSDIPVIEPIMRFISGVNRNVKLAGSLILILCLVSLLTLSIGGDPNNTTPLAAEEATTETPLDPGAQVVSELARIDGNLETLDTDGEWTDAPPDLEPAEGTALRTVGITSRAIIRFNDGSELRIDGNSEVRLGALSENRVVIEQISGNTYSRVADSQFIVKTEKAQYEALGTAFRTVVSGDEDAIEVFHSEVVETTINTEVEEGERLVVDSRVNPVDNETVEDLDIERIKTDAFITWNRNRDLENDTFNDELGFLADYDAPSITITDPADNATVLLEADATEATVIISGTTEPDATLSVLSKSQPDSQPINVSVADDGSFTTPVLQTSFGSSVFTFTAKDRVGNTTELNVRYTLQRKSASVESGSIIVSAELDSSGQNVDVTWVFSGTVSAPDGIIIVYDTNVNPRYDDDVPSQLIANGNSLSLALESKLDLGTTYYFRACIYDAEEDQCSNYSNTVSLTTPVGE